MLRERYEDMIESKNYEVHRAGVLCYLSIKYTAIVCLIGMLVCIVMAILTF